MQQPPLRIGLIGGTGLGQSLGTKQGEQVHPDTPFGKPASPITLTQWQGVEVAILQRHGPGHTLNPSQVPYRANMFALKSLGCTHILASGATGSLREDIHPGQVVIVDQFIDKTTKRANTFYDHAVVHVELAEPCCPVMRQWLNQAATTLQNITVHPSGTYVCMEGPAFSTKAESHMHRKWGGDLIGMTAMPEAKLAREAEMAYALIALPTDYDCWREHEPGGAGADQQQLLAEIFGNLKQATQTSIDLIQAALSNVQLLRDKPSPAHDALTLAIFCDKKLIEPEYVKNLSPLWGRHFTD